MLPRAKLSTQMTPWSNSRDALANVEMVVSQSLIGAGIWQHISADHHITMKPFFPTWGRLLGSCLRPGLQKAVMLERVLDNGAAGGQLVVTVVTQKGNLGVFRLAILLNALHRAINHLEDVLIILLVAALIIHLLAVLGALHLVTTLSVLHLMIILSIQQLTTILAVLILVVVLNVQHPVTILMTFLALINLVTILAILNLVTVLGIMNLMVVLDVLSLMTVLGIVSLSFRELSKIISRKYTMPENTFMVWILSWNFVRVPKA